MRLLLVLFTYLRTLKGGNFGSRAALERWQKRQIRKHLAFLSRSSPFYRALGPKLELGRLPIVDKNLMMAHFDEMNTRALTRDEAMSLALAAEKTRDFTATLKGVTIGLSSGTSGNRGIFAVSDREQAMWAGHLLAKVIPRGLIRGRHRAALFLRANSNLYEATGKARIQFKFFDLLHPFEQHEAALNAYQPTTLIAPPSLLRKLAARQLSGVIDIAPGRIYAAAEVLDDLDAAYISRAFQQDVHQIYQATEGFLGISCAAGQLHLNEDIVYVEREYIDAEKTRFVPIITDFRRRSQPIVRYRLNDILSIDEEPCACGSVFTRLRAIEGRCDDMLHFVAVTGGVKDVFPDFIRRALISADEAILEYRVRQTSLQQLTVELILPPHLDTTLCQQRIVEQISSFCHQQGLCMPVISFAPYHFEAGMVKLRRIMNEIPKSTWQTFDRRMSEASR